MRATLRLVLLTILVFCSDGRAAEHPKTPRVGILLPGHGPRYLAAFDQSLRKLGYVDGRNIFIDHPYWNHKETRPRLPELAAELVRRKVKIIVPHDPAAAEATLNLTRTIPVVMPDAGADPVASGFVKSLTRPGGNATGLSTGAQGLESKSLDLLKETLPSARRLGFLNPHVRPIRANEYKQAARLLGLDLKVFDVRSDSDLVSAFAWMSRYQPDAVIIGHDFLTGRNAIQIGGFLLKNRIPAMSSHRRYARLGGLMSYGVNHTANWRRAAVFIDKILKGADPATLPVEPPQVELVVNLKTAETIGVKIPPEILLEAHEVIR